MISHVQEKRKNQSIKYCVYPLFAFWSSECIGLYSVLHDVKYPNPNVIRIARPRVLWNDKQMCAADGYLDGEKN